MDIEGICAPSPRLALTGWSCQDEHVESLLYLTYLPTLLTLAFNSTLNQYSPDAYLTLTRCSIDAHSTFTRFSLDYLFT